LIRIWY